MPLIVVGTNLGRPPAADVVPTLGREVLRQKAAPELTGGVAWLNTAGPFRMKDLRGKVVLLDFWTFCCINCIHVLPDLAKLEKKYPKRTGRHRRPLRQVRQREGHRRTSARPILRYEIKHPVVNDAEHEIWKAYDVSPGRRWC